MKEELKTVIKRLKSLPLDIQVEYANKINAHLNQVDELREEIQHGLDSGEPTIFDLEEFKTEARGRLKSRQNASG
ncbi:MAG: hypothetical protein WA958_18670 [Tunicatimonas sp.]